jgi:hypothetical protein
MMGNNKQVSFHYAVDDYRAVQGIEENRNGWHAGDGSKGAGNRQGIGIEICYSKSGGERFNKAEDNAVELVVSILKRYGWGIEKVTKHQDYSGKYCPHRTLDLGWERFINKVKAKLNESAKPVAPGANDQVVTPYLVKINSNDGFLNVRAGAGADCKINTTVKNGGVYTIVAKNGNWGRLKSGAGYIYLPLTTPVNSSSAAKPTPKPTPAPQPKPAVNYYAKCSKHHNSIVNALKEIGVNNSFANRKKIAQKNGYAGNTYKGTPAQNVALLNKLKQGKLIKA